MRDVNVVVTQPIKTKAGNANVGAKDNKTTANVAVAGTAAATEQGKTKDDKPAAHRQRKRHFYNQIRAQMEFYFGDANLSKDRYLNKLIEQDAFVALDVFLSFNKMKALAQSVADIAKALSNSQFLVLDETGQRVKRKTAPQTDYAADERTLYVEALPPKADHDWLRHIFERFGAVAYVSLPKYAKSHKNKEFAFVEFAEESSLQKALAAFAEFSGVLCTQTSEPAQLASVQAYIKEQAEMAAVPGKKKKRSKSSCETLSNEDEQPPASKKIKKEDAEVIADETAAQQTEHTGSTTPVTTTDTELEEAHAADGGVVLKKKRRKRSKKCQHLKKLQKNAELNTDAGYLDLKVLPKREWKRLRNKYLNLQRQCLGALKRKARQTTQQMKDQKSDEAAATASDAGKLLSKRVSKRVESQQLHKMNMNFYGASSEESNTNNTATNMALQRAPLYSFEPGLIIELSFKEPCTNVKVFKNDMRQHGSVVKYVDVKEGAMQAYLRIENAAAAQDLLPKINGKLLTGEAETEYWHKIERDREMKLNKQIKLPQKRGREKIKKLTQQHIRFDAEENSAVAGAAAATAATINQ